MILTFLIINSSCSPKIIYKKISGLKFEFEQINLKPNNCIKEELPWFYEILKNEFFIARTKSVYLLNTKDHIDYRYLNDHNYKILNSKIKELDKVNCFDSEKKYFEVFKELNLIARRKVDDDHIDFNYNIRIYNIDNLRREEQLNIDAYFKDGKLMFILHSNPIIIIN